MSKSNLILTGLPRSGTTLVCFLLNMLPDTVALHEPMNVDEFPDLKREKRLLNAIESFFAGTRQSLKDDKTALSKHIDGCVPDNPISDKYADDGLRKPAATHGRIFIKKPLSSDFLLAIKHPAAFTACLSDLVPYFPCFAVIRNPLSVMASWNTIDIPHLDGHAPAAESLDDKLSEELAGIKDRFERQVHLLSWYYGKYRDILTPEAIIRYEDVISSGGSSLMVITPLASRLRENLLNKNENPLYDYRLMQFLKTKLLQTEGAFWNFYSRDEVESLIRT